MSKRLMIGIDAGGTKTKVLLGEEVDGQLRTIGEATGTGANPRSIGFDAAFAVIEGTVRQAYVNAGIEFLTADSSCFSVAGAGRPEERRRILAWCAKQGLAMKSVAVGDAECMLASLVGHSDGIAIVAGTGSMAWGRNAHGETARAGGYGYLLGDEGSGYWIAARLLNHVCRLADTGHSLTTLVATVLDHLRLPDVQALIDWCYGASDPRSQIASLAPIVFDLYAQERVAAEIVHHGARELASLIIAVSNKLNMPPANYVLFCAGSVLVQQALYLDLVIAELEFRHAKPEKFQLVADPVFGALQIAWENRSTKTRL